MKSSPNARRRFLEIATGMALSPFALAGCAGATSGSGPREQEQAPIATVEQGKLRGRGDGSVVSFKRVPYAANPYVPERRFLEPHPMPAWDGVRDATLTGPMPPQPARPPARGMWGAPDDMTLNIWAPRNAQGAPVLVFIPGGAFFRADASESWSDGSAFARDGIVAVTINYRVGIDGFMWIDDAPANRGLLDQVAALQWVQRNIAAFGGDPSKVTLAGQSAGAQSVLTQMADPVARGTFQRAIAESPAGSVFTPELARRITHETSAILNVQATRAGFAQVPMERLVATCSEMARRYHAPVMRGRIGHPPYLPVVDGHVQAGSVLADLRRAAPAGMPLLTGCTDEETRLYLVPGGQIDRIQPAALHDAFSRTHLPGSKAEQVYGSLFAKPSPGDLYAAFLSDETFRMVALRAAEIRVAAGDPVWFYNYGWPSRALGGRLGAAHVTDLPYFFDTLDTDQAKDMLGGEGDRALANKMHAAWVSFIRGSDPGWPQYNLSERPTMHFDEHSDLMHDPMSARRRLWKDVPLPEVMGADGGPG